MWDSTRADTASYFGRLEILKYLSQNNCSIERSAISNAITNDKVNCLKFLHNLKGINYLPSNVMEIAVINDSIECLKYLDKIDCKSPWYLIHTCANNNSIKCLKYIISKNWFVKKDIAADILFRNNDRFNEEYLDPLKIKLVNVCINNNSLECLKYLLEEVKIKVNKDQIKFNIIRGGECMRYLKTII